jgi:hypothetical protein
MTEVAHNGLSAAEHNRIDNVRYLISAMMLGQMYAQHEAAGRIRAAVAEIMGDDGRQLRISLAFASAMGGDASVAKALLEEGLDDWPEAEMAKVALSLALKVAGDPLWQAPSEEAIAVSVSNSVRRFAYAVLSTE